MAEMSKDMKNRILIQLSLRSPEEKIPVFSKKVDYIIRFLWIFPKELWNDQNITGDKSGVWGDAIRVTGPVDRIKGPLGGIEADVETDIIPILEEKQRIIDELG